MKNKLQQFIVKLLAATLAIIMAVPTNVFAMSQRKSNTYTAATSVMGIQPKDDAPETETSQETNLLKSAVSTEETTDYIIEKSANLSQTIGQVTYKIAVKTKDPSQEFKEDQTTTFGITENTDLKDLKVEKVQALDADGKEIDVKNTLNTPKAFNSTDNIRTLGITATKPQYGMVYYLSAQLTEEALKNLDEKSPQLALDITIASPNQDIFQTRYSLETTKPDTTEITIDNDGNLANQTSELVEKEDNLHLYKGEYKQEEKTLFQTTPAHIVWTDYINAKDDKEFTINFDLDENQDTENIQINIDYYEARDKGYVLNQSFSKTLDFTNSLNLTIPQGYIAKVSLSTAIKENTNAKEYTFNGVKVANPTYKEEKTEKTEEEQATDDADPLPDDSSKNDGETKPSNDSIADESEQDFSQNPKSDTSAIALNKEAYLENLRDEEKLTENLEKAANDIELALESYNKEETNWDEFKVTIQAIAKEQNLDQAQTEETLQALLAGLNEDKYKVANIDTKEATNLVEESTTQSEPTEKSVDELVKEKLNEEGFTLEDFQNYMYELEEKYNLTNEDAARIYENNAEAIQALVNKAQEEKTTGDVFAVDASTTGALDKAYPYDLHYFSYSYLQDGKVNWDIQIHTDELKAINDINYNSIDLNIYAPVNQGLTDYRISVSSSPDNFKKDITDSNTKKGKIVYKDGTTSSLNDYNDTTNIVYESLSSDKFNNDNFESSETMSYHKKINRGEIPDVIFVHVEATPLSTDPKSTSYDLGLRLTPDNNYIHDLIVDFQDQWNQLISAIPWIIPYKSGEAAAAKFANGFNLVDTRVLAKVTGLSDDVYERYDYMDKSRSVFGTLDKNTKTKTVKWHISDTIRLQDDQSQLGNDIFNTSFVGNTNTANPHIEVLSPNDNGGYEKILSTNSINSGSALRSALNKDDPSNPGLKPGTIINYVYNNTSDNIYGRNTITVPFSQRFDDGVGYYGGKKTASIRMFTKEEQRDMYHLAIQINDIKSNANRGNYLYNTAKTGWTNVDTNQTIYDNPLNAGNWRILENYDMVVCLNPGYKTPLNKSDFFNETQNRDLPSTYFKKKSVTKAEDIKPYLRKSNQGNYQNLYKEIQKIFFYLEEVKEENNFNDSEIAGILQAAIFDAEGIISDSVYNNILYISEDDLSNYKKYLKPKLKNDITKEERNSVDINIYYINYANNNQWADSKANNGEYQNLITGKVQKPITLSKEFINGSYTGINGSANFEVVSEDGTYKKSFSLTNNQETKLYLEPGIYTIRETSTTSGYNTLKDIKIRVYDDRIVIKNNDIPLAVDMNSVNLRLPYGFSKNDRPNRYYIEDGELIEWGNDTIFYNNPPYNHYNEEIFRENTSYNNKKYIGSSDYVEYGDKSNGIVGGNYNQTFRKVEIIENPNDNKFTKQSNLSLKAINDKSDKGEFKVYKQFKNANGVMVPLREITFNLYRDRDGSLYDTQKTGFDGYASFKDLPSGTYILKEEKFEGLEELSQDFRVVVQNGSVTISAINNSSNKTDEYEILNSGGLIRVTNKPEIPNTGNFKIKKVNGKGQPLENVGFTLYQQDKKTPITNKNSNVKEYFTNADGYLYFSNLPNGTYYLKETTVPNGYTVQNDGWAGFKVENGKVTKINPGDETVSGNTTQKDYSKVEISNTKPNDADAWFEYEIVNTEKRKAKFAIKKIDSQTQEILEGAEFTLRGGNLEKPIVKRTSTNENPIIFENLDVDQSYVLEETRVPVGYKNENRKYTVNIDKEGNVTIDGLNNEDINGTKTFTIANTKIPNGRFRIEKVDESNKPLDGVTFTLTPDSNTKGTSKSTDANGIVEFTNLTPGNYTLVESETKSGYIKTNQTWKVVVADNGKTTISSAGVSLTNALNSIDISESYASELPATNKVNFVFIVENIKGKSENTIKQFNDSIETIRKDLADKYGSNATITLVSNGHQVMQGFKNGQPVIYANRPVTSNEEFKLVDLDQNGGDSHLDVAIENTRAAINGNKADNYVFIMQSGNAEGFQNAFNNKKGLFRPEDNVKKSVMMFENASKDTINAYTSGDRLGGLVSDKDAILTIDNQSIESIIKSQLSSTGVFESTNNNSSEDNDYIVPDAQEKALNNLDELKSKGFIITNSSNYQDSNISIIKVVNKKPTYPSTGGSGTFIGFALIGTAIMLAGIAYYGIYVNDKNRRRSNRYGK